MHLLNTVDRKKGNLPASHQTEDRGLQKRVALGGSSTLRGTGQHLRLHEHDTCVMVNGGAQIEDIDKRLHNQCRTEDIVVLHCGGNNMEADSVDEAKTNMNISSAM